jgi:hypothetical protein
MDWLCSEIAAPGGLAASQLLASTMTGSIRA